MHYKDTDYLHAVSRVTYLENELITEDDLMKAVDSQSVNDAFRLLSNKQIFKEYGLDDYEKAFEQNLAETYYLIEDITKDLGLTYIFRYPIDGHNLKVIIKSKAAEGDFSHLYKAGGTIDPKELKQELDDKRFELVPETLGIAALEAEETLAKTRDSQVVDLIIDRAVIAMMGQKAAEIDREALTEYVQAKIDLTNIRSALRLLRMKKDTYAAARVFAEGGSFTIKELDEAYGLGYQGIAELSGKIPQSERMKNAISAVKGGGSFTKFEQQVDGCFKDLFEKIKIIPFGIEPVISFLYLKDREIRAARLVLVSKIFGLAKEQIAERLRYIYAD